MNNNYKVFSKPERALALVAGAFNAVIGFIFFFLPELPGLHAVWPVSISPVLDRFIGAIILGNAVGALWLSTEQEWARVRPLALVAAVYGTLVALALLYHLLWLKASSFFWFYFLFDVPFLLVFYGLFIYHDIGPLLTKQKAKSAKQRYV
jgi:Na+/melibiose symporter-like transporter